MMYTLSLFIIIMCTWSFIKQTEPKSSSSDFREIFFFAIPLSSSRCHDSKSRKIRKNFATHNEIDKNAKIVQGDEKRRVVGGKDEQKKKRNEKK